MHHDLAIIGSGFGGSITALVAKQVGMEPVLIERGKHPRFAIGESSTAEEGQNTSACRLGNLQADFCLSRVARIANIR